MFKINKPLKSLLMVLLFGSTVALAQTPQQKPVADEEIKQFADAFKEVQVINQDAQQIMIAAVTDEGLELERFTEIYQSLQMPDQQADVSEDEMKKYENASSEIEKIQADAQVKMEKKIVDAGLTPERYQEIGMALQTSPELQEKIQKYL
jgi:predicted naringenin-chalcone synthase